MWNFIMYIWLIISVLGTVFPFYQGTKGKVMTWREAYFFLFGLFVAGMPFIYLTNR